MTRMRYVVCAIGCGLLFAARVQAGTLEEDEARLDALLAAKRAAAAAAPAPVVASVTAPSPVREDAGNPHADWLAPAPERTSGVAFADLSQYVGARVTIVTAGERVHRGVVTAANARQVVLRVHRRGGNATYALRREQVTRIDAY